MASYIEVISIVDHHKLRLQTSTAPTLLVGDAQACNTLVAEQSLRLNVMYGGQAWKEGFFVSKERELFEYFSYLYGILDDTDLLSKVSRRDVICVKNILDRMAGLVGCQTAVSFDCLAKDAQFAKKAAKLLLQSTELHSVYSNLYIYREQEVEAAILAAVRGAASSLFLDTKEQNGCCRVGQAKLFQTNIATYQAHRAEIIALWQKRAEEIFVARPHIDFFLQMMSSIPSANEVYHGTEGQWDHQDEIWIWTPEGGVPQQHLIGFLNGFHASPTVRSISFDVEIVGPKAFERQALFEQNFSRAKKISAHVTESGPTYAFLRFPAGAINSRKSQISPFLPKVVP